MKSDLIARGINRNSTKDGEQIRCKINSKKLIEV